MSRSARQQRRDDFKFHSGRLSLDLVATLGSRGLLNVERIPDETALTRWLRQAGLIGSSTHARPSDLRMAVALREVIYRAVTTQGAVPLPSAAVEIINDYAAQPSLAPQISENRSTHWQEPRAVRQALSTIARDAVTLLSGSAALRIRQCARPGCTIFFVDASRNGRRRWCSMDDCGNAVKGAAFTVRRRERSQSARAAQRGSAESRDT